MQNLFNKIQAYCDKLPIWARYTIYAIIILIVYLFISPIWAFFKNIWNRIKAKMNQMKYEKGREIVQNPDGTQQTVNTVEMANELFDAFFANDWMGGTEDEDRAVKVILECPSHLISRMAINYQDLKKSLNFMYAGYRATTMQQDLRTFLDDVNYQKVKHKLI